MFRLITLAVAAVAGAAGCSVPAVQQQLPAMPAPSYADPADDCAPGEIVISVNEEAPCDLVGGANTLTLTDISREMADQYGCTFDGDDAGVNCDF